MSAATEVPHGPIHAVESVRYAVLLRWRDFGGARTHQLGAMHAAFAPAALHEERIPIGSDEEDATDVFFSMSHLRYGRDRVLVLQRVRTWYAAGGIVVDRRRETLAQREFPDSGFRGHL